MFQIENPDFLLKFYTTLADKKTMGIRSVKSESGSILIVALVTIAFMSLLTVSLPNLLKNQLQQNKMTRLRQQFKTVETLLRSRLNQSSAFVDCTNLVEGGAGGETQCKIRADILESFGRIATPGTECIRNANNNSNSCGIELKLYDASSSTVSPTDPTQFTIGAINIPPGDFSVEPYIRNQKISLDFVLTYTGSDVQMKNTLVNIEIPFDILQDREFDCAVATAGTTNSPVFKGFSLTGKIKCTKPASCPPGQFAAGINATSLEIICNPLNMTPSCADTQMITRLDWSNGNFTSDCNDRLDPFVVFPFTPTSTPCNPPNSMISGVCTPPPSCNPPNSLVGGICMPPCNLPNTIVNGICTPPASGKTCIMVKFWYTSLNPNLDPGGTLGVWTWNPDLRGAAQEAETKQETLIKRSTVEGYISGMDGVHTVMFGGSHPHSDNHWRFVMCEPNMTVSEMIEASKILPDNLWGHAKFWNEFGFMKGYGGSPPDPYQWADYEGFFPNHLCGVNNGTYVPNSFEMRTDAYLRISCDFVYAPFQGGG